MKRITKNLNKIVRGANALSLGISIVAAVAIGVLMGYYLSKWTGFKFFFWFFAFCGVGAAFLNIYRAYKVQMQDMKDLENDPKYKQYQDVLDKQNAKFDAEDEDEKWS
ncbi:AtpZ/AtpI family protein [Campylobacter geochelonis]|uniref:AtpZ/AtpI family protein n=1 Tax=Campylobacter geochelonis TaxID=1780362 RepID=UPI000770AE59|nr:AtpZ/AtpI family protein [Campylobacter geochelonis]CZE51556.1 arginine biosynthesis bifunctional protein ArgJ [Campylobacter geochelonis]